jgi:hypothetical protein
MAFELWRIRVDWSGWAGAPGYTTMFADTVESADQFASEVRLFFQTALSDVSLDMSYLPGGVKITFPTTLDRVDADTNNMIGTVAVSPLGQLVGTGTNLFAGGAGCCVTWKTGDFHDGRRVVGRTFLIPLNGSAYDFDGTLGTAFLAKVRQAATSYATSGTINPMVMSRVTPTHPGGAHTIIAGTVSDRSSGLRTRRY